MRQNLGVLSKAFDMSFKAKCYSDAYMRGPPGHPGPWTCVADKFLVSTYPTFYETSFYLDSQQRW